MIRKPKMILPARALVRSILFERARLNRKNRPLSTFMTDAAVYRCKNCKSVLGDSMTKVEAGKYGPQVDQEVVFVKLAVGIEPIAPTKHWYDLNISVSLLRAKLALLPAVLTLFNAVCNAN